METQVFEKIHQLQKEGWWFGNCRNQLVVNLIKKHFGPLSGARILDIGCSEGSFLDYLAAENADFEGIDVEPDAIRFCDSRGLSNRVRLGSALQIPFEKETFDVVTLLDIVEHVKEDDSALAEAKRVLKPGGKVVIIVPAYQWLWSHNDVLYHHVRRYGKTAVKELLASAGLKIQKLSFFNCLLFPAFVLATFMAKSAQGESSTVLKPVPKPLNWILSKIAGFESLLICNLDFYLPFGGSIVLIAEK